MTAKIPERRQGVPTVVPLLFAIGFCRNSNLMTSLQRTYHKREFLTSAYHLLLHAIYL